MTRLGQLTALLLGAVIVLCGSKAHASTVLPNGGVILDYVTGGVNVYDGKGSGTFIGRTFGNPGTGQAAAVSERYGIQLAGKAATITAARTLALGGLAADVVALKTAWNVGQAIGGALADYLGLGTRVMPEEGGTGWQMDAGTPPSNKQGTCYKPAHHQDTCLPDMQAAARMEFQGRDGVFTLDYCDVPNNFCSFHHQIFVGNDIAVDEHAQYFAYPSVSNITACEASTDALNPAFNIAAGAAPGPDGQCRTGRYNHISDAAAVTRLTAYANGSDGLSNAPATLAQHIVNDLQQPLDNFSPMTVTGPSEIPGDPSSTTTTAPDGSTTTTTTTPTTHITYNDNHITTSVSTTTQTCVAAGSCTTTTTNTSTAPKPDDPCVTNPNALACISLGDPPSDKPDSQSKQVDYSAEDLGLGGGCPAPFHVAIPSRGWDWTVSYQPLCDTAPLISPGIIALAALAAAIMVAKTVSSK